MALGLLREGYCSIKAVVKWAKENKYPLPIVSRAIDALAIERFEHHGEIYFRLSGQVVPILPRNVRDVRTYRQAGGAA